MSSIFERFTYLYQTNEPKTADALREVYADDVVFIDPAGTHEGITALSHYFAKSFAAAEPCVFAIHAIKPIDSTDHIADSQYLCQWQMTFNFRARWLRQAENIQLDGISVLTVRNDRIIQHRDYCDLGAMVYEHIPLLGRLIKRIKAGLCYA